MNELTEREFRSACATALALCEMIIAQGLWPDLDPESLEEFKASVRATRDSCQAAIRSYDALGEPRDAGPDE